ncbi:uncharacterized protein AFUA_1G02750 [Aspergillus fumigatus Af293]|uniref:Uncharacterized protein n=1 Tax=Aspergillus fumigatus (strain ATCC MYA-4609 / CBS 101355 / FGSC A1100 / Af293) TaxID=330879 RepID=Q4WKE5_ASPFU|nr:hypothetical protein AFUA_1G02750 [Aspergillus fumigatus Af293]EAL87987.1 hypothetical protein AFUA_1G02750 [Aspergillus fumigatus Af293]
MYYGPNRPKRRRTPNGLAKCASGEHAGSFPLATASPGSFSRREHNVMRSSRPGRTPLRMESVDTVAPVLPTTQRTVIIEAGDRVRVRDDMPLPTLEKHQFLIRTEAVVINPSDTKTRPDYTATVVACRPEVTEVKVGDRVCGAQHAMNANTPHRGSFGEHDISSMIIKEDAASSSP